MKIMGYEITSGPNPMWWLVTIAIVGASIQHGNYWVIAAWIGFNIALIPICLWLHKVNDKQRKKMREDFPHDPYIQQKYKD